MLVMTIFLFLKSIFTGYIHNYFLMSTLSDINDKKAELSKEFNFLITWV